jgi:hypothetical protein
MTGLLPIGVFTSWLATGERGLSSETIVTHLTEVPVTKHQAEPRDPSDFRRCERLLRQVPLARLVFPQMKTASPVWARLVAEWDALVALLEEECPGAFEGANGSAPRTFHRIKELNATSRPERPVIP